MGVVDCAALRQFAAIIEMRGQHLKLEVQDRFQQADLHQTALAGDAAPHQTSQYPLHQMRAGEEIDHRQTKGRRRAVGVAIQPHQPGYGLQQQVLPRLVDPGSLVSVAGDFAKDDARVDVADGGVVQAQARHDARTKVLHDDIGSGNQRLDARQIGGVFQVGGKALLVAVDGMEERAFAVQFQLGDIQLAAEVAAVGTLDLDDARAQIPPCAAPPRVPTEIC